MCCVLRKLEALIRNKVNVVLETKRNFLVTTRYRHGAQAKLAAVAQVMCCLCAWTSNIFLFWGECGVRTILVVRREPSFKSSFQMVLFRIDTQSLTSWFCLDSNHTTYLGQGNCFLCPAHTLLLPGHIVARAWSHTSKLSCKHAHEHAGLRTCNHTSI